MDMRQASTVAVAPMSTMIRQKMEKNKSKRGLPQERRPFEGRADWPPEAIPGGREPPGEGGEGEKRAEWDRVGYCAF